MMPEQHTGTHKHTRFGVRGHRRVWFSRCIFATVKDMHRSPHRNWNQLPLGSIAEASKSCSSAESEAEDSLQPHHAWGMSHPRPGGWGAERFTTVDAGPGVGKLKCQGQLDFSRSQLALLSVRFRGSKTDTRSWTSGVAQPMVQQPLGAAFSIGSMGAFTGKRSRVDYPRHLDCHKSLFACLP